MIFQDPSTSLNPRQRISQILDFPLRLNTDLEPEQRRKQIIETMADGRPFSLTTSAIIRTCWRQGRNSVWD
ncbi:peptide ABC transporter ATP-binding protein [Citrobacter koseri]|nr:peptide ABC transporter ATP-binding protein [Citrobacter koseri]